MVRNAIQRPISDKKGKLNVIFVVDIKTLSDWMRTLKYDKEVCMPVSYTHLTLPTILRV